MTNRTLDSLKAMHEPELTFVSFCFVSHQIVAFCFKNWQLRKLKVVVIFIPFYDIPASDDLAQPHEEQETPSRTLA